MLYTQNTTTVIFMYPFHTDVSTVFISCMSIIPNRHYVIYMYPSLTDVPKMYVVYPKYHNGDIHVSVPHGCVFIKCIAICTKIKCVFVYLKFVYHVYVQGIGRKKAFCIGRPPLLRMSLVIDNMDELYYFSNLTLIRIIKYSYIQA